MDIEHNQFIRYPIPNGVAHTVKKAHWNDLRSEKWFDYQWNTQIRISFRRIGAC